MFPYVVEGMIGNLPFQIFIGWKPKEEFRTEEEKKEHYNDMQISWPLYFSLIFSVFFTVLNLLSFKGEVYMIEVQVNLQSCSSLFFDDIKYVSSAVKVRLL